MRITLIGAGRVATHLGRALRAVGNEVSQVYSRTVEHARLLAEQLHAEATNNLATIRPDADAYLFCLKDAVLEEVSAACLRALKEKDAEGNPLFVHTGGSMALEALPTQRKAVLWPMQTFSMEREIDWQQVHVFLESPSDEALLRQMLADVTPHVLTVTALQRQRLHLASVFACNFTNHMFTLSARILEEIGVDFGVLLPLVEETVHKVHKLSPREAQTGPAVRGDENVMRKHLEALHDDASMQQIYQIISKSIYDDQLRSQKN